MKKLTKNNIAYDLRISPHSEIIHYEGKKVKYVFSSDLYRRKFMERRKETRTTIEEFISRKYDINVEMEEFSDFYLYKKIEKRGFLIYIDDTEVLWEDNLNFGNKMTMQKNFVE